MSTRRHTEVLSSYGLLAHALRIPALGFAMLALSLAASPSSAADCTRWPNGQSLQEAVAAHPCVDMARPATGGPYLVEDQVILPPGHVLTSAGATQVTIRANPATFPRDGRPVVHATNALVTDLTIDGGGVAMQGLGFANFTALRVRVRNAACAGVTIAGPGVLIVGGVIERNAWPTYVPALGRSVNCGDNPQGGNVYGAGIYVAPQPPGSAPYAPVIVGTTINSNHGPAIDAWQAHGGQVIGLRAASNAGWAAVHLYESQGWLIQGATIQHASWVPFVPHLDCYDGGPLLGAAVRSCGAGAGGHTILHSTLISGYAVLGDDVTTARNAAFGRVNVE